MIAGPVKKVVRKRFVVENPNYFLLAVGRLVQLDIHPNSRNPNVAIFLDRKDPHRIEGYVFRTERMDVVEIDACKL